jgi:hypothetical protein
LVNSVADGAADDEITPSEIAEIISDAREAPGIESLQSSERVRKFLGEALDAVADGMPADYIALHLYAALGAITDPESTA